MKTKYNIDEEVIVTNKGDRHYNAKVKIRLIIIHSERQIQYEVVCDEFTERYYETELER